MKNFPHVNEPTGWFMLGWSDELANGEVKAMTIFSQDVVVYRTEDGELKVADAHCPHLGASLAVGGKVCGENIACPFHGWQFDGEGRNAHIPNVGHTNNVVRLRQWPAQDVTGIMAVWHDKYGRPPHWEWPGLPELADQVNFYPQSRHAGGVRKVIPQQLFENNPDPLHFPHVHGSGEPARHVDHKIEDHTMEVWFEMTFGAGLPKTWMTPNGPAVGRFGGVEWGLGFGSVHFTIEDLYVVQLVAATPVDLDHSLLFSTTVGKREADHPDEAGGRTGKMMEVQHHQISQDFKIWENQVYVEKPPYAGPAEFLFPKFRKWVAQFYPEAGEVDETPVRDWDPSEAVVDRVVS